jgi:hypothetical protein
MRIRLGWGEFAATSEICVEHARLMFLQAATEVVPEVAATLKEDPYRAFLRFSDPQVDPALVLHLLEQDEALGNWARRWNLIDDWCQRWAYGSLISWAANDASKEYAWPRAVALMGQAHALTAKAVRFQVQGWSYTGSTRQDFESLARKRFEQSLARHCDRIESAAAAEDRQRTVEWDQECFHWLAKYQVGGQGFEQIWRSLQDEERKVLQTDSAGAVALEIERLARYIDLTLRSP